MITLRNATCGHAGTPVLHDVTLRIAPGEMVGLLGPNGSGKTTLLLTLSSVLPLISGSLRIHGQPAEQLSAPERARLLASVPQRTGEIPTIKAFALVLMGRYPHISFWGGYTAQDRDVAMAAMRETGTAHLADRPAHMLSGGELQRVFIARALAQNTQCLLLDEATSGLDIARKVEIFDLLRQRHATGTTIISAIHDLNLAALYCQRLILLKQGRIAVDGPVCTVFTEAVLSDIYETRIRLYYHPTTGTPQACLVPGGDIA